MGYSWLNIFTTKDKILLVAIVLCSVMLFFLQEKAFKCYRHFFLKKEVEEIFEREEVHAEIKDEKAKPVAEGSGSHVYQLEEKVYFNSDLRELNKGDDFVKLSPLAAKLLKGLLEAKDNFLRGTPYNMSTGDGSCSKSYLGYTLTCDGTEVK